MAKKRPACAKYIYALTGSSLQLPEGLRGIADRPVRRLDEGPVAAIVSDVNGRKLRPVRRHLSAHVRVTSALCEHSTVLPMTFGVTAPGAGAVRRLLVENRDDLVAQIDRLDGKVEMGLRISWDVPSIFEHFVATQPELRSVRDELYGRGGEPSYEEKIELGRLFEQLLEEKRSEHSAKVEEIIAPVCSEIRRRNLRREPEVASFACLVPRDRVKELEDGILRSAQLFDDSFAFDYNGPWPPAEFVDLHLAIPRDH